VKQKGGLWDSQGLSAPTSVSHLCHLIEHVSGN